MIAENFKRVLERMAAAARRAGRDPAEVRLVGVTKGVSVDSIRQAIEAGLSDIGENRVQEAQAKRPMLDDVRLRWHMVGHLQRNKAKWAVRLFDVIHSVDSIELIEALERASIQNRPTGHAAGKLDLFIQVNVSGEASKHGCRPEEVSSLADRLVNHACFNWVGLMTLAPYRDDPEEARPWFAALRQLRDRLQSKVSHPLGLSMGMSHDFEVAIEEGATWVRIGSAIFKDRS